MKLETEILLILGQCFVIDSSGNSLRYAPEFATEKLIELFNKTKIEQTCKHSFIHFTEQQKTISQ